jgi:integrase
MSEKGKAKKEKRLPKGVLLHASGKYLGRVKYLGITHCVYGDTPSEVERKLNDLRYELSHGLTAKKPASITVDRWHEIWINEYKEPSCKHGTVHIYKEHYRLYIKKHIGNMKLQSVHPEHIQKIYNDMNRRGYSMNTIELVSTILSGMFRQAYKNQRISSNPVPLATLPRAKAEKEKRVMTLEEQKLFLEYAKNSWIYPLVYVALYTGMRSGELRGLTWDDIDFDKGWIHINKSLIYADKKYILGSTKTSSSIRRIPMLGGVSDLLKQHRKEQLERRLLLGEEWREQPGMEKLVFPSDTGYPMNRDRLKVQVNKIVEQIQASRHDFPHITPHTLRHTFATRCIENGMQPKVLQKILGHSKLSQTMDLYVHTEDEFKAEEMKKLEVIM